MGWAKIPGPFGTNECARSLALTRRPVISPVTLLTMKLSGVTSPATRAEPSPQVPSMATTERSPVTGLHEHHPGRAWADHALDDHAHGQAAFV